MSYSFQVTINGRSFTQNDFIGMNYVQGVPDALESIGDAALSALTDSSTTTFTPGNTGSQTLTLVAGHISFDPGSVVMAYNSATQYQVGEVTAWDPVAKTLTIAKKKGAGASGSSWTIFQSAGPSGYPGSWDASRRRFMDEGGFAGVNGLTRRYQAPAGMRSDSPLPSFGVLFTAPQYKGGWSARANRTTLAQVVNGTIYFNHGLAGGSGHHQLRLEKQVTLSPVGKGMVMFSFAFAEIATTTEPVTWFLGVTNRQGTRKMGLWITIRNGVPTYELIVVKNFLVVRQPVPDPTVLLLSMEGNSPLGHVQMFALNALAASQAASYLTPGASVPWGVDEAVFPVLEAETLSPTNGVTSLSLYACQVTQPLRYR